MPISSLKWMASRASGGKATIVDRRGATRPRTRCVRVVFRGNVGVLGGWEIQCMLGTWALNIPVELDAIEDLCDVAVPLGVPFSFVCGAVEDVNT